MKALLQLIGVIATAAHHVLATTTRPEDEREARLRLFDINQLERGINALRAVRILCAERHWEFASGIVRQLFEQVLNMEHLGTLPDRDDATFGYAWYGVMQRLELRRLILRYQQKSGLPFDEDSLTELEQVLDESFPAFRSVSPEGKLKKLPSWSGHNTRYLAQKSKNPLREDQYDLMFSTLSEQAHGAPAALIDPLLVQPGKLDVDELLADDNTQIAEKLVMAIMLFLDLWKLLPHIPQVDVQQELGWRNAARVEGRKFGVLGVPTLDAVSTLSVAR
jgi:hypothetical protein